MAEAETTNRAFRAGAIAHQRLLGTIECDVVSAIVGGGFDGEFMGHSLGHAGGDTAGVFGGSVVTFLAVVQPEFASPLRAAGAIVGMVVIGLACGTTTVVVGCCGIGGRRMLGPARLLAAATVWLAIDDALFFVARVTSRARAI